MKLLEEVIQTPSSSRYTTVLEAAALVMVFTNNLDNSKWETIIKNNTRYCIYKKDWSDKKIIKSAVRLLYSDTDSGLSERMRIMGSKQAEIRKLIAGKTFTPRKASKDEKISQLSDQVTALTAIVEALQKDK